MTELTYRVTGKPNPQAVARLLDAVLEFMLSQEGIDLRDLSPDTSIPSTSLSATGEDRLTFTPAEKEQ